MKLVDRQPVLGTTPTVYIGHRPYKDKRTGQQRLSRTWYAEYSLDGRHYYESLATTNKAAATRKAHAIVQRIESGQSKPSSRRVDLRTAVKAYLEMLANRGRAPKTLEKYTAILNDLSTWAEQQKIHRLTGIGEREFWRFHQKLVDDGLAAKTRYTQLTVIKQLFRWSVRTGLLVSNPIAATTLDTPPPTRQPCFSPDQVQRLLSAADPHEQAIYAVMAYAGLRFGEVRDLLWSDVLLDQGPHGFLVIQRGGSGLTTKDKATRRIPVRSELRRILDRLPRDFDRVFTARPSKKYPKGGGPIDERRLLTSLKRLCRRCGFANPNQYKLHTFRHTFASMCARHNISYKYALAWMGHSSSEILDLYYTMFDDTAVAAIETIVYQAPAATQKVTDGTVLGKGTS